MTQTEGSFVLTLFLERLTLYSVSTLQSNTFLTACFTFNTRKALFHVEGGCILFPQSHRITIGLVIPTVNNIKFVISSQCRE